MSWRVQWLSGLLMLSFCLNAHAADDPLKEIQTRYEQLKAKQQVVSATFKQTISNPRDLPKVSAGTVVFSLPGKMRWEYEQPHAKLFLSDGVDTWLYDARDAQAIVATKNSRPFGMAFLWGEGDMTADFEVKSQKRTKKQLALTLTPKRPLAGVKELNVVYRFQSGLIEQVKILDAFDVTSEVEFTDIQVKSAAGKSAFAFKLPDGVALIDKRRPVKRADVPLQ